MSKRKRKLFEMFGGTCHLCDMPIWFDAPHDVHRKKGQTFLVMRHGCGPTIDHLVPRSKGGSNALSNLRLAHKWCNSTRGTMPVETFRARLGTNALKQKVNMQITLAELLASSVEVKL